jgi:branched-chain amino acid transport system permease protein
MSDKTESAFGSRLTRLDRPGVYRGIFQLGVILLTLAAGTYLLSIDDRTTTLLFVELFVFAVAAMSFDLLFGYAGILSFGHALFFGGSVYVIGLAGEFFGLNYLQAFPFALLAMALLAFVVGALALRSSGVYFAMITLAFGQLGYELVLQFNSITGGANGIVGIDIPTVAGIDMSTLGFAYYFAFLVVVLTYFGLRRLVNSPFGRVLQGIRENEERMRMLGIDPYRYKLLAFTIAGIIAAIGGALYPLFVTFISPSLLFWTTSGDILIITLIGGFGTLWGSIVGSGVFIFLESLLGDFVEEWRFFLGITFILIVLLFPSGIAGLSDRQSIRPFLKDIRDGSAGSIRDFVNRYRGGGNE